MIQSSRLTFTTILGLAASFGMMACGSDNTATDAGLSSDQGPAMDSGVAPGDVPPSVDVGPTLLTVSGHLMEDSTPIAGASIEVVDASPANRTMTDMAGAWSLTLRRGETALLRSSKTGYRSFQSYRQVSSGMGDVELQVRSSDQIVGLLSALHVTETATQGMLLVHFFMPVGVRNPAGFGVTLGAAGGTRFVFSSGGPTLQNLTAAGDGMLGIAGIPAGTTTVTPLPPPGVTCTAEVSIPTYRVDPSIVTNISFICQ